MPSALFIRRKGKWGLQITRIASAASRSSTRENVRSHQVHGQCHHASPLDIHLHVKSSLLARNSGITLFPQVTNVVYCNAAPVLALVKDLGPTNVLLPPPSSLTLELHLAKTPSVTWFSRQVTPSRFLSSSESCRGLWCR